MLKEPSDIFIEFIRLYPRSGPAKEWQRWGSNVPDNSGSFTTYLYAGNVLMATRHADVHNKALLRMLLFPDE